ncbi:MAG: hypothetical protein HOD92_03725, partial [Deltaproteobacteria bacterium]|nr:hypothetical protein [Deltaproteobacteria bacterium]
NKKQERVFVDSKGDQKIIKKKEVFSGLFWHKFTIVYTDEHGFKEKVGEGILYSNNEVVFQKVRQGFIFIVFNAILKTIALWVIFLWMGRMLLSRPLHSIIDTISRLDLDTLEDLKVDIKTSGKNELKILEDTFNFMTQKLFLAKEKFITFNRRLETEVTQHKQALQRLQEIEWLLTKSSNTDSDEDRIFTQPYGDLSELNTCSKILDSVGAEVLSNVVGDYLDLLKTSSAVYEENGDYAVGIFSSGWCQFLDQASRNLCDTDENQKALESGKWLCHESCWKDASKVTIDTGQPNDIECQGGIRLYATPIIVGGKPIGSINFGYGDPPKDLKKLHELAEEYDVDTNRLKELADSYESRPSFIVEVAKKRLSTSAKLIGEIVERKLAEKELNRYKEQLEGLVKERTTNLEKEIAERKQGEELIRASLKEKETLLHEIHHRVKNNLTVVSSLLNLQANSINDDRLKEILKESQSRIYAMSTVHETLYGSENLAEIDLKLYLSKISGTLIQTYIDDPAKVTLKIKPAEIKVSIELASPIGLIINELISNSLKYAFPDKRTGEITVEMKKLDKELELTVADNGVGISEELDWKNSKSLGLKLVRNLVENQLDGSIDMESKNGTKFIIKFNIET